MSFLGRCSDGAGEVGGDSCSASESESEEEDKVELLGKRRSAQQLAANSQVTHKQVSKF